MPCYPAATRSELTVHPSVMHFKCWLNQSHVSRSRTGGIHLKAFTPDMKSNRFCANLRSTVLVMHAHTVGQQSNPADVDRPLLLVPMSLPSPAQQKIDIQSHPCCSAVPRCIQPAVPLQRREACWPMTGWPDAGREPHPTSAIAQGVHGSRND